MVIHVGPGLSWGLTSAHVSGTHRFEALSMGNPQIRWFVVPSDGVFTRRHTAECAFCTVFYSVFCFSTMLPWGGRGGGAGTTVSSSDVFCLCPFALVFTVFFPLSHFFFLHHLHFPSVYSVFRLHDVADATLHIGVGWGGAITFMWTWQITLLRLHHVADATGGMLTFHVTCSRCWCYATLGWGGMLTFHVTCSRCWCYATRGWGGDVNVPCNLLTLLMLCHAGVGVGKGESFASLV